MTAGSSRPHAPSEIIDPAYYAAHGYPHDVFAELRDRAPVAWCEAPGFEPFWAVTAHEDVVWLSKHPETFENAPLSFIAPKDQFGEGEDLGRFGIKFEDLLHRPEGLVLQAWTEDERVLIWLD